MCLSFLSECPKIKLHLFNWALLIINTVSFLEILNFIPNVFYLDYFTLRIKYKLYLEEEKSNPIAQKR